MAKKYISEHEIRFKPIVTKCFLSENTKAFIEFMYENKIEVYPTMFTSIAFQ